MSKQPSCLETDIKSFNVKREISLRKIKADTLDSARNAFFLSFLFYFLVKKNVESTHNKIYAVKIFLEQTLILFRVNRSIVAFFSFLFFFFPFHFSRESLIDDFAVVRFFTKVKNALFCVETETAVSKPIQQLFYTKPNTVFLRENDS